MTRQLEAYECKLCGNIVEVIHAGDGELVCCGQPMEMSAPVAAIIPIRDNQLICNDKLA
jgi:desulfoferrodoxin-like iron-binding protein